MIRLTDPAQFGPTIAGLRATLGQTQGAMVTDIGGMNQGQLSDWEHGRTMPKLPNLIKLANGLGHDLALIPKEDA